MRRIVILGVLILAACVPAVVGLVGNTSFGDSVPVRVPSSAVMITGPLEQRGGLPTIDDSGAGPSDPHTSDSSTVSSSTVIAPPSTTAPFPMMSGADVRPSATLSVTTGPDVDDHGGTQADEPRAESVDDHGGRVASVPATTDSRPAAASAPTTPPSGTSSTIAPTTTSASIDDHGHGEESEDPGRRSPGESSSDDSQPGKGSDTSDHGGEDDGPDHR